jgi:hypothetical protein
METKSVNFNGRGFPAYLNYGVLDEKSLRLDGEKAIAEYVLDQSGELVHRVYWGPDSCKLETFRDGKRDISTQYFNSNLKEVLLNEYLVNHRFYQNDIFLSIISAIKTLDGIQVDVSKPAKEEWNMSFYPAGKLFTFRIPYGPSITKIKEFMEKNVGSPWLGEMTFHDGFILSYTESSGLVKEQQAVVEFPVPLAYVIRAADIIIRSGMLSPGPGRIVIQESCCAEFTEMSGSIGQQSYALCFRDLPMERQAMIEKEFMDAVHNFQKK